MSERLDRTDPARLDELSAVTKAYARFSGPGIGLAAVLAGAWVLAGETVRNVAPRAGELLLVLAPLVLVGTTSAARAYYQRHGRVVATEAPSGTEVRALMAAFVLVAAVVGIAKQLEGPRRGYELLAVAAFAATAAIAVRGSFRWDVSNLGAVASLLALATLVGHGRARPWDALDLAFGMILVAGGVISHLQYRRIERRLAALRGTA